MATVNGGAQKDFIHRLGDGLVPFPGYNDVTGLPPATIRSKVSPAMTLFSPMPATIR